MRVEGEPVMEAPSKDPKTPEGSPQRPIRPLVHAVSIAAIYVVVAGVWIAVSDFVLSARSPNARHIALFALIKGEAFVLVTSIAI